MILPSYDFLHRVPTKARDLLGIGRLDPVVQKANEKALVRRAVVVTHSVGMVAQKLIEPLRGRYWDEDIWTTLRCLVEIIQAQGGGQRHGWL